MPERSTHLLWVVHQDSVLLERRPSPGIWGGLLSLPEFDGEDADGACRRLGVTPGDIEPLPPITHAFTHFRLTATPWRVAARAISLRDDARHHWIPSCELCSAALPAPIRKLLLERDLFSA